MDNPEPNPIKPEINHGPAVQNMIKSELPKSETKKVSVSNYKSLFAIFGLLLVIGYLTYSNYPGLFDGITGGAAIGEAVKVDLYVMSQCPYGVQAENVFKSVKDKLGENLNLNIEYIGRESTPGVFESLHGEPEVNGDIAQVCAKQYFPAQYFNFIVCQNNNNPQDLVGSIDKCASETEIDANLIKNCMASEEGKTLLRQSFQKAATLQVGGSPTIFIAGTQYGGGRKDTDFIRAICNAFDGGKPKACSELPEIKEVNMIVLNDKRCGENCDVTRLVASLQTLFPKLKITNLEYTTKEGKEEYDSLKLTALPAILFDDTVTTSDAYENVAQYLVPTGDYLNLMIGASYDPSKEICDNKIDDTNDGKIDCDDADCINAFECRPEVKKDLQLFIMSDCPYGRKAVEALKEVVNNFKDMTYSVHYIANEQGEGFTSLHGQYEVDEDIVQLCVKKYSPAQWLDYMYCRATDGVKDKDWNTCALNAKVDTAKVKTCSTGNEGKSLLREDIKLAQSLSISGSPTWIANNKKQFGGIDAETVKQNYCASNPGISGCANTLTSNAGTPAGNCGS
jgi:glutaredoxin